MRRPLFWKILVGVWAMFLVISLGIWLVGFFYFERNRDVYVDDAEEGARHQLQLAAIVTRYGGRAALADLVKTWPEVTRKLLTVSAAGAAEDAAPHEVPPARPATATVTVQAPDGVWRLAYRPYWNEPDYRRLWPFFIPLPVRALEAIASLLFSAILAWHLTQPIHRLRGGFERLARGDLGARLNAREWKRRDEIADLARDFDLLAAQLQQLVGAREQLLHDVSHELRTPLARLRLAIDLARQDPKKIDASLERIDSESRRLDDMVGELLTLSRIESGVPTRDQYFDVAELVRAVVCDARFEADHAEIAIRTNVKEPVGLENSADSDAPAVKGDAELLRRGLENVVRNALRFSARGQTVDVDVTLDEAAQSYVIDIRDQGPGVPPEALKTMFEPFVRVGGTSGQGFGLGLAIARRAVLAHGGLIEAHNRAAGGLHVAIRVPLGPKVIPDSSN